MTTTAAATVTPIRDAEFGAGAFATLAQMMHQTSQVAAGDHVRQLNDTRVCANWPDNCFVEVRRESLMSHDVTVEIAVGGELACWMRSKRGVLTVMSVSLWDYEFGATVSDSAGLERVMQELLELRAVCSRTPEESLAPEFSAYRMAMD